MGTVLLGVTIIVGINVGIAMMLWGAAGMREEAREAREQA